MNRDVVRVTTGLGLSMIDELQSMIYDMRWFIALCIVLIAVDLVFGIERAIIYNENIRKSRAIRKTINKFIDYMCWVLFAGIFAKAFAQSFGFEDTTITAWVMFVACISEIDSILQNYIEAHGKKNFSILRFILNLIKRKNKDIGNAIEDTINEKENENK